MPYCAWPSLSQIHIPYLLPLLSWTSDMACDDTAKAPAIAFNFTASLYDILWPCPFWWGKLNLQQLHSYNQMKFVAGILCSVTVKWPGIVKLFYPVSLPQGTRLTTDLNCFTVLLPREYSGVKGRCLAPFLFLTLCEDSSHGKQLWGTKAHSFLKLGKSLDQNWLLKLGNCFTSF